MSAPKHTLKQRPVTIRFEPSIHQRLTALSAQSQYSVADFVRFAVDQMILPLENKYLYSASDAAEDKQS